MRCLACGSTQVAGTHYAVEKMYGLPGEFLYDECVCGSLSLRAPTDLDSYYPEDYYSLRASTGLAHIVELIRSERAASALLRLLASVNVEVPRDAAILDVGAGSGTVLSGLARRGYRDLTGIDPFLEADRTRGHVRLLRRDVTGLSGSWDVVMFNHSLEHVVDPKRDLQAGLGLLRDDSSFVLVRIPIVAMAWRTFYTDWIALDAPRHIMLPTERGFQALAENAGGQVEAVVYDSTALQFWGSAWYRKGRRLNEVTSRPLATACNHLWGGLRYARKVGQLNKSHEGDAAAFVIRRH